MSISHVGGVLLDQDMEMRDYLRFFMCPSGLQLLKRNQSHPAHPSVYTKHHPEAKFFGGEGDEMDRRMGVFHGGVWMIAMADGFPHIQTTIITIMTIYLYICTQ